MYDFTIGEVVSISNLKIMIYEGTEDKPYEKYGATPSTEFPSIPLVCTGVQKIITCRKNILNTQKNASSTSNGVTATTDENGIITVNGTTLGATYLKLHDDLKVLTYGKYLAENKKKYFSRGKYILSFKYVSGEKSANGMTLNLRNEMSNPDVIIASGQLNTNSISIKSELIRDFKMFMYIWIASGVTFTNYKFAVQIEKVDTLDENATEYESYSGTEYILDLKNIELCKIINSDGNIVAKDKTVCRNNKWQWEKEIRKTILNGNNTDFTISKSNSTANNVFIFTDATKKLKVNSILICDKFKQCTATELQNNSIEGIAYNTTGNGEPSIRIGFGADSEINTVDKLKTYLASNNITIYSELATPEYIDCTAEQSAILDKLYNNFTLQKGTNNIIVESTNGVGVNLELEYMQDNNSKHDKDIAELKQAIVALGGVI